MNPSPWAALLASQNPGPTTTQEDPETPPEGSPAPPGSIPDPVTMPRQDIAPGWRGGEIL